MLNCDQVFEQLKAWAASQPNSIIDVQPTPTPEDTLVEKVIDGYTFTKEKADTVTANSFWMTLAEDREAWAVLEDDYCNFMAAGAFWT